MAEPGNQPGQSKDGTKLSSLHMCAQGWPRPLHKWVHQLQQGHCLLHGGSHELLKVRNGKALHDVKGEFLPDYQKKCDGNIVIALVVVETGLSQKNPDNYPGQLLLQTWPGRFFDSRRKSFQTPVYIKHNLGIGGVVDDILLSGCLASLSRFNAKQSRPDTQPDLIRKKAAFTGSKLSKPIPVPILQSVLDRSNFLS